VLAGCTPTSPKPTPTPTPTPTATVAPPPPVAGCATNGTPVAGVSQLEAALKSANPGDVFVLEPGTYVGNFSTSRSGVENNGITLCGPRGAILDGERGGYALHLLNVAYWTLTGFSVTGGQKGVVLDGSSHNTINGLSITQTGDEALHLRTASQFNVVENNTISNTGLRAAKYGEGIYVGTAQSNWCSISGCKPDQSDNNQIISNTISNTTAENIDIKEGTANGVIRSNRFDGAGMTAADSYIDVKGSDWTVTDNTGVNSVRDGAQVHVIKEGPGSNNTFSNNHFAVPAGGFAIDVFGAARRANNHVLCSNTASTLTGTASSVQMTNVGCVGS
jgi:parallel beta-helix repeat protein